MDNTELIATICTLLNNAKEKDEQILAMEHDAFEMSEEHLRKVDNLSTQLAYCITTVNTLQEQVASLKKTLENITSYRASPADFMNTVYGLK